MTTPADGAQETPAANEPAAAAATVDGAAPAIESTPAARPEGLAESYWDSAANAPKWGDLTARVAKADELEAAATARAAEVPATADAYVFDIPGEPIKLPDGTVAKIDPADPLAQGFAKIAHENALPQAVVAQMARLYAETSVNANKTGAETIAAALAADLVAEKAKLGEGADARITAATAYVTQHAGEHAAVLNDLIAEYPGAVPALEALIARAAGPGVSTLPGQGIPPKSLKDAWFPNSNMPSKAA